MSRYNIKGIIFLCFLLSGAASISYQLLWLRNAIAYFGVITPVISSVLSVFMLGLALGNFFFGKWSKKLDAKQSIVAYAVTEFFIGIFALAVPILFKFGYAQLLMLNSPDSYTYLFFSWAVITLSLLPACIMIGATMPLMMRFLEYSSTTQKNFGFLYLANLLGALIGSIAPLLLIEVLGFAASLHIIVIQNIIISCIAFGFLRNANRTENVSIASKTKVKSKISKIPSKTELRYKIILFITGFAAIGSEVLWVKAFTPVTGTTVYSFAFILAIYLISNLAGNYFYICRKNNDKATRDIALAMPALAGLAILGSSSALLFTLADTCIFFIAPICIAFGYLTPQIIDKLCANDSEKMARAYMYNFLGCILGPLFTSYILFPIFGLKFSLIFYCVILIIPGWLLVKNLKKLPKAGALVSVLYFIVLLITPNYEDYIKSNGELRRDNIGYIGATGTGMDKLLSVNGIGMTHLLTITKDMIHLPLAHHNNAKDVLIICMGMGTTLRSATTWPVDSITVVELSRAVTQSFGYFHSDTRRVLNDPRVKIVIDDGRRYLNRTNKKYDLITIDPPPPFHSSGSGLLYSDELISLAKSHLNKGGIFAHWIAELDDTTAVNAILAAVKKNFKYVKVITSLQGWGMHIIASDEPIKELTIDQYISRLPLKARADLHEWETSSLSDIAAKSLHYIAVQKLKPDEVYMSDDNLLNEFFLLRFSTKN